MKKFLTLLGSVSLTAGTAITVISCGFESNLNYEFSKILNMNEEQRTELENEINQWMTEISLDADKQQKIQELLKNLVDTYPEGMSDEDFNNEVLYHMLAWSTLNVLKAIEQANNVDESLGIDKILEEVAEVLTSKFVNSQNKSWAQKIINLFENHKKSID